MLTGVELLDGISEIVQMSMKLEDNARSPALFTYCLPHDIRHVHTVLAKPTRSDRDLPTSIFNQSALTMLRAFADRACKIRNLHIHSQFGAYGGVWNHQKVVIQ